MRADLATENGVLGDHDLFKVCSTEGGAVNLLLNGAVKQGCSVMELERLLVEYGGNCKPRRFGGNTRGASSLPALSA